MNSVFSEVTAVKREWTRKTELFVEAFSFANGQRNLFHRITDTFPLLWQVNTEILFFSLKGFLVREFIHLFFYMIITGKPNKQHNNYFIKLFFYASQYI